MTDVAPRFRRARVAIALVVAALASLGTGQLASAHTEFDSSVPSHDAVVDGPLTEVVVNFTNPARPAGEGFVLLDPHGTVRSPSSIDETDGTSFVLSFDPQLEVGSYGLRWSVQAGDAHPIGGSFQFEIVDTNPAASPLSSTPTTIAAPADVTAASPSTTASTTNAASLDGFLNSGAANDVSTAVGRAGRTVSMLGMIFGIGVLAALIWTLRGDRDELVTQLNWVRLAGLVVFTGGLIEYAALAENDPAASFVTLTTTKPGLATLLKMVGGLAVMFGFHQRAGRIVAPTRSLSAAASAEFLPGANAAPEWTMREDSAGEHRWTPTPAAALGLLGLALVVISFWFDGHTVSKGPWAVHSFVNMVHLGAAAIWGGGVFAMTTVSWMRRRRSQRLGLAAMVVRFSSIATVSLVAVIVAGLMMTWLVLDAPGDLLGTPWGRVLIAKTVTVAVAAGLGGYNHFRLRPALDQRPDDPRLARELRISLSIESAVFITIVILTAVLVASAT